MKSRTKILKWFVPRWSRARDLRKLVPVVFGVVSIIRVVVVSVVVGGAICLCLKFALPQIQLAFVWKALFVIPAMYAYLGAWLAIRFLVPGQVKITEKHVFYSAGGSAWRANLSDIESSRLIVYSSAHIRLIIRVKGKMHKFALPSSTDLQLLISLVSSTVVFDRRTQFEAARSLAKRWREVEQLANSR